jgi:uncharacterized repeat protein (TIGR01451 family)
VATGRKNNGRWRGFANALLFGLWALLTISPAAAQTVNQYSTTTTGAITDNNCGTAAQITRTFTVPSFIVGDVDLAVLASHTYRSDLRITLRSPAGPTVTVMTWSGNVQSGDNLNDRFDDEAVNPITAHNATVNESVTPTLPNYLHQFQPSNPLSAFDGQNAGGVWTMVLCDGVGTDTGTFLRADLFITSTSLSVAKTSSIVSDPINNLSDPKAIPGAIIRYCILATNNGGATHSNVTLSDPVPVGMTYVIGSMRSGTTCAGAATVEDEDTTGADDTDTVSMSVAGSTVSGSQASLAAGASVAFVFNATMN